MDKIILNNDLLLARGGERFCFIHPEDKLKIIKILNPELKTHNQQNELEYTYYEYLYSNHKIEDLLNIAQCFGWVNTNYGKGLMFQRILDFDGEQSKYFRYYLRNNLLSKQQEEYLLNDLKFFLEKNLILFIDVSTVNLFCKRTSENDYKLVIFDGLGARRKGIKLTFYMKSRLFSKYKIKKQWKKFLLNCTKDKLYQ
jgi:hypothetical protein